jgi:hypothetical protein
MPRRIVLFLLAVWASAGVIVGGSLMRSHWVPLPVPAADSSPMTVPAGGDGWATLHVLQAECGCSRRVLARLRERPPEPGVRERVLWVSDGPDSDVSFPDGYEVERLSGGELARKYHIAAAPVLVVIDPTGAARYCGGYTARKRGPDIRDLEILRATRGGTPPAPLPVYGCAVAAQLKDATNILPPATPAEVP